MFEHHFFLLPRTYFLAEKVAMLNTYYFIAKKRTFSPSNGSFYIGILTYFKASC